jgi:hypothetical protein
MCFKVWEGGSESNNNSNEMVAKGTIVFTTNTTCTIKAIDVGKKVDANYDGSFFVSLSQEKILSFSTSQIQ